ncbi:hypothetical protein PaeBR_10210 [Paenibacillus sp. BR2-3]|uniref:hypothetical protein n=1 Tax=Paenibacillus sp. BR2-3 TaxID=3048494 RepID=UPI0039774C5D
MLDFLLFMVFSVLESSALFFLAFKIFKIDLYSKEIIFAGLIMGFFSYIIRHNYGLAVIDVLSQYILVFCFFWLLFRIHIFYAAIMTGMAYQAYMLIQSTLYLIMNITRIYGLHISGISVGTYLLQFFSALTAYLLGYYIGYKRKGFDFIPDKPDGKIAIGKHEKILLALTVPSAFVVVLMLYFFENLYQHFFLIPLFYALLLFGYLYLSNKKDRGDEY